jgi:alkylated DNA repair dioxygenase AlkB
MSNQEIPLFGEPEIINYNDTYKGKVPGLDYFPNFIDPVVEKGLIEKLSSRDWLIDLTRRVQHYGYMYDYKRRRVDSSMRIADPPAWIQEYSERLYKDSIFNKIPDQVIVNEYKPGQGISKHIDCEPCFTDTVASLSLGSKCIMDIINKNNNKEVYPFLLEPGSLIVLKGESRYEWMHRIRPRKTDKYELPDLINKPQTFQRELRISITFRKVILQK